MSSRNLDVIHYTTGDCVRSACGIVLREEHFSSEVKSEVTCSSCKSEMQAGGTQS